MTTELIILFSLLSMLSGFIFGLILSILYYPGMEVKKVIKIFKKEGYSYSEWKHMRKFVDHHMKVIVKPNCETLYSVTFIRRKDGPYMLKTPAIDSYFSFAFLGLNTDVLGYFTNRDAIDSKGNKFLISYRDAELENLKLPGIKISSEICWIIGRFGVSGPEDIPVLNKIQDSIELVKLQDYLNETGEKY